MENIYFSEWSGLNTGWSYRFSIFEAKTTAIPNDANYIELPYGSIIVKKLKKGYQDGVPIGMENGASLEVEIDFTRIPDDTPVDFFQFVQFPNFNRLGDINTAKASSNSNLLAAFKFEVKINDVQLFSYVGVLDGSPKYSFEDGEFKYTLPLTHWVKKASENMYSVTTPLLVNGIKMRNRRWTIDMPEPDIETSAFYADYDYTDNGKHVSIYQGATDDPLGRIIYKHSYYSMNVVNFFSNSVLNSVGTKALRNSAFNVDVRLPLPKLYRQTHSGTGELGGALIRDSSPEQIAKYEWIYVLGKMSVKNYDSTIWKPLGGFFGTEDDNSIFGRYKNSLFDFLHDCACQSFSKAIVKDDRVVFMPAFGSVAVQTLDSVKLLKLTLKESEAIYSNVVLSIPENFGDNKFKDIDHFEYTTTTGTENKSELQEQLAFNNMPTAVSYSVNQSNNRAVAIATFPKNWNLYCSDGTTSEYALWINNNIIASRVHEYCDFKLSNKKFASDLGVNTFIAHNIKTDIAGGSKPSEAIEIMQQETCLPVWWTKTALYLFGSPDMLDMEIEADFSLYAQTKPNRSGFIDVQSQGAQITGELIITVNNHGLQIGDYIEIKDCATEWTDYFKSIYGADFNGCVAIYEVLDANNFGLTFDVEMPASAFKYRKAANPLGLIWARLDVLYKFNINSANSRLDNGFDLWAPVDIELDFENETATVKLVQRMFEDE